MSVGDPQAGGAPTRADTFATELPAVPRSVSAARAAVAELAERHGVTNGALDDIRLAVSEAATNVVVHAYHQDEVPGRFRVCAAVAGRELEVVVEDDGCGPHTPTPNAGLGMGVKLMDQICDRMQLSGREAGGTTVRLCFAIGA